jgi:hypothetical protein
MSTRQEMLIEANRRGLLKGEQKAAFDMAVQRGLIAIPEQQSAAMTTPTGGEDGGVGEGGFFDMATSAIGESITGSERSTGEIQSLDPVGNAPELNALTMEAAKMGFAQLFGSDKSQEQILQNMGGKIGYDEKGNTIVELPSGRYALNKPGLSPQDVASGIAQTLAFAPAAGAGTIAKAATGAAATETALKGAVQAAGGEDVTASDVAIAGALGGAGKAAEGIIGGAYRMATGRPTGDAASTVKFAEEQGVPLLTTDVSRPSTFVGKSAQSAAEKIPVTGTGAVRAEQQEARSRLVDEFAQRFGEYRPDEVVASLQRQTNKVKRAAGAARQNVMSQMDSVAVTPSNAIKAIDDEIARLSASPSGVARDTADTQTIQKLQAYKNDLEAESTFQNLEQLRTNFRTDVKGERMVMPGRSEAAISKIYSAMSKDMDDAVTSALPPEQARKWAQSNAVYAAEANKIKNTRLKGILQKGELTPEAVNTMLFSNKPSETKALYSSLDKSGRDAMRAGLIGKALEKSSGSPDRFLGELNKMGDKIGIAFRGEDRNFAEGLQKYLAATRQAANASLVTPTGQQLMQVAVPAGVTGDVIGTGGIGTASALGYGLIARAYESKPVRNAVLRLRAIKPGSTAFENQLSKVQTLLTAYGQSQTE